MMNMWIIILFVISLLVTIISFVFIVKDLKVVIAGNLKGAYIVPNVALLIVGLAWFALTTMLFLNIQNQLSLLTI